MKPILMIGALIWMVVQGSAFGQSLNYQDANRKLQLCRMIGQQAERAWQAKESGAPAPSNPPASYISPIILYANAYGYMEANSMEDARSSAWSYCMDNLDRLAREEKYRR